MKFIAMASALVALTQAVTPCDTIHAMVYMDADCTMENKMMSHDFTYAVYYHSTCMQPFGHTMYTQYDCSNNMLMWN